MADAPVFDWLCKGLEERTSLDRLEARGTVRLALKSAGLDPRTVTTDQMSVVIERLMENELTTRGIDAAAGVCSALVASLATESASLVTERGADTPDQIFGRLGGDR